MTHGTGRGRLRTDRGRDSRGFGGSYRITGSFELPDTPTRASSNSAYVWWLVHSYFSDQKTAPSPRCHNGSRYGSSTGDGQGPQRLLVGVAPDRRGSKQTLPFASPLGGLNLARSHNLGGLAGTSLVAPETGQGSTQMRGRVRSHRCLR